MGQWFSHIDVASIKSVRKESQTDLAIGRKGRNTSVINEQGIVWGLFPAVHGVRTMKNREEMYKKSSCLKLVTI